MLAVSDGFTQSFRNNCGMNHKNYSMSSLSVLPEFNSVMK